MEVIIIDSSPEPESKDKDVIQMEDEKSADSSPEPESKDQKEPIKEPKSKKLRLKKQGIISPGAVSELLKDKRAVATKLLKEASVAMTEIQEFEREVRGPLQVQARLKEMKSNFCKLAEKAELAAKEVKELEGMML